MVVVMVMVMGMGGLFDVSIGTVTHNRRSDAGAVDFYWFFFKVLADGRELKATSRTVGGLRITILLCH
jgi:hypothetical protein